MKSHRRFDPQFYNVNTDSWSDRTTELREIIFSPHVAMPSAIGLWRDWGRALFLAKGQLKVYDGAADVAELVGNFSTGQVAAGLFV